VFQRRRAKVLLALLVVVALALITLDFRGGDDGATITMRSSASSVLSPVQDGVSALVRPFENMGDQISDIFNTRSENQQLREQITELEERHRSVVDLERENAELRELRKRNKLLEQEVEVLRRAAAYLSQAHLPGKGSTRS